MIRRIDDLGRVVIPKEIRKDLDIREGDPLFIRASERLIVMGKHKTLCAYCRVEISELSEFPLCDSCLEKLRRG